MTDRHNGYLVIFEKEIREDDSQPIIDAIKQLRGVIEVTPCVTDMNTYMARSQAHYALLMKFRKFIREEITNE